MHDENIIKINIDSLIPSTNQPRKIFNAESLKELSESIKEYGILNPILVKKKFDKYEIIAGERRVRAAKLCGLNEVPAIVKDISDDKITEIALTESIQRENINPIDEAKSYKSILETTHTTEKQLSKMIGKSQSYISNKLRLLNLPKEITDAIINRQISERHGRTLISVKNKDKQITLLNAIIKEKLSVKELEKRINQKEEKESDNMNNESFFPNFNGGQASLNSMNMQAMQPAPAPMPGPVPAPQPVEPQPNIPNVQIEEPTPQASPIPEFGVNAMPVAPTPPPVPMPEPIPAPQPVEMAPPVAPVAPIVEPVLPVLEQTEPAPVPMPAGETPLFDQSLANQASDAIVENIPLFNEQNNVPPLVETPEPTPMVQPVEMVPPVSEPVLPEPNPPVADVNVSQLVETPMPEPTTIPVNDKLSTVEEFLRTNNIEYKLYKNETNSCIIIEM